MRFNYLTLLTALLISSVAIYYSVAGLATIFAASAIPVIIMGTSLEIGKLISAVWLHKNWHGAVWWLKTYLSAAVIVLMLITSMGIFGYLSKSHVEQASASQESVAQVDRITSEMARNEAIIQRSEQRIHAFEENGSGVDASIQTQIDREQDRINTAYTRVQPMIDAQTKLIADDDAKINERAKPYLDEIASIAAVLTDLQDAITTNNIKRAQGIVGTKPDGDYGEGTATKVEEFRSAKNKRRKTLLWQVDKIKKTATSDSANAAQEEIARIRLTVQAEITESNKLIARLRTRIGTSTESDVEQLIIEQQVKIKAANDELDTLTQDKFKIEAQYRKLEAEVGPIKYIAEFLYSEESTAGLLEKAVRWVIIMIIVVFDPLAVLLLIATQYSFDEHRKQLGKEKEALRHINGLIDKTQYDLTQIIDNTQTVIDKVLSEVSLGAADLIEEVTEVAGLLNEIQAAAHIDYDEPEPTPFDDAADDELEIEIASTLSAPVAEVIAQPSTNIHLVRVSKEYTSFNGKVYRDDALISAFPEFHFNFNAAVRSGDVFPSVASTGTMFIRTNTSPTELYIHNNNEWSKVDKNLLNHSAYSHEYIKALIKKLGNHNYNPELLNDLEVQHIEELLTR
jgi:hypothetical protein